jgi:hypothetical protein
VLGDGDLDIENVCNRWAAGRFDAGITARLDDNPTGSTVSVPPGRHRITLAAEGEQPRWFM